MTANRPDLVADIGAVQLRVTKVTGQDQLAKVIVRKGKMVSNDYTLAIGGGS